MRTETLRQNKAVLNRAPTFIGEICWHQHSFNSDKKSSGLTYFRKLAS